MKNLQVLYIVSIPSLILVFLSVINTISRLSWHQQLIPELDLTACPPLTSNPKRLWAYWHRGVYDMPIFVQQNIKMWQALNPDWEIRLIQGADYSSDCHYTKLIPPELLPVYISTLQVQKLSDAVRLALIRLYGGVYMDVTNILFEPLDVDHWNHVSLPKDDPNHKALVGYYFKIYCLPGRHDGFEIWMIVARANEPLIVAWHDLFLELMNQQPLPFIRNETTKEQNPMFKSVDFSALNQLMLNYGVSTTCLHALLQLNATMNDIYENKSLIRDAEPEIYKVNMDLQFSPDKLYNFFVNSSMLTRSNLTKMLDGIPLMKVINHAWYMSDARYEEWSKLDNIMAFTRMHIVEKGKKWKRTGVWDRSIF